MYKQIKSVRALNNDFGLIARLFVGNSMLQYGTSELFELTSSLADFYLEKYQINLSRQPIIESNNYSSTGKAATHNLETMADSKPMGQIRIIPRGVITRSIDNDEGRDFPQNLASSAIYGAYWVNFLPRDRTQSAEQRKEYMNYMASQGVKAEGSKQGEGNDFLEALKKHLRI